MKAQGFHVALVSPMPTAWIPLLWEWMHQHPECNCDDRTPKALDAFRIEMESRMLTERTWGVTSDGVPCGMVAFALEPTADIGLFHGICFDEAVWGTGVADVAVRAILDDVFQHGVKWIGAGFFASNRRVHRFLSRLGAEDVGQFVSSTTYQGRAVEVQMVGFIRPTAREQEPLCQ